MMSSVVQRGSAFPLQISYFRPSLCFRSLRVMSDPIELRPIGKSVPLPPPRHPAATAPGGLGKAYRAAEERAKAAVNLQEGGLDATSTWGLGAAVW